MGGPCDNLVPVAILYSNPKGLTLRQFQIELNKIIPSQRFKFDLSNERANGKYGLAGILNLDETEKYKKVTEEFFNKDFQYNKERFISKYFRNFFEVIKRSHKLLEEKINFHTSINNSFKNEGYKVGDYLDTTWLNVPEKYQDKNVCFQVTEILNTKLDDVKDEENWIESFEIEQDVITRAVEFKTEIETFSSLKKLKEKYPCYSPEKIYNFSQEEGFLYPDVGLKKDTFIGRTSDCFKWKKKNEKYFLDVSHMMDNLSSNSVFPTDAKWHWSGCAQSEREEWKYSKVSRGYSLTDLILTCEAVRKRDQDILGYNGFRHRFFEFIYGDKETLGKYEKAILDNEVSQIAKAKAMNHFDFLREHHSMMKNINSVDYKTKVKFSKMQKEKYSKEKSKWVKKNKHLFKRKDAFEDMGRDELPF